MGPTYKTADGLKCVPLLSWVSECGVVVLLFENWDDNKTCWMNLDNPWPSIVQQCKVTEEALDCVTVYNAVYCVYRC